MAADGNQELLIELLKGAEERHRHHHSSLWEEQKHFTWWIYVVLAGLLAILLAGDDAPITDKNRGWLVFGGAIFGIFVCWVATNVVKRESEYFLEAMQISSRIRTALGLHTLETVHVDSKGVQSPQVNVRVFPSSQIETKDWKTVASKANRPLWKALIGVDGEHVGIREWFRIMYLVAALIFACFAAYGLLHFHIVTISPW